MSDAVKIDDQTIRQRWADGECPYCGDGEHEHPWGDLPAPRDVEGGLCENVYCQKCHGRWSILHKPEALVLRDAEWTDDAVEVPVGDIAPGRSEESSIEGLGLIPIYLGSVEESALEDVANVLAENGFPVIVSRTRHGGEVRCYPNKPGAFVAKIGDSLATFETVAAARRFIRREKA